MQKVPDPFYAFYLLVGNSLTVLRSLDYIITSLEMTSYATFIYFVIYYKYKS